MEDLICNYGTYMANWQGACERHFFIGKPWENRIAKRCCDCCMLGMASAEHDSTCEMTYMELGRDCEHVAKMCCDKNSMATDNSTEEVRNCSQLCIDDGICACFVGYRQGSDGITCEDINECLLGAHNCVVGQTCINTEGSFRCQREISCDAGYELVDRNRCRDIDECALNRHNCGPTFECANTEGSFRCYPKETCSEGFVHDAVGNCIDIDECVGGSGMCQPGHTCGNTVGSFICRRNNITCGRGYHLNVEGTGCEDVDECQTGNMCRGHSCVNMLGTYRCKCNTGFLFNNIGRFCEDINECKHYPQTLCAHKCVNTEGTYLCSCSTGFRLSIDGKNCEDVDECKDKPCSQDCRNVYGSYECFCYGGYQLRDADGVTCEDIDECALPTGSQMCTYRCSNALGSYECTCPSEGYTLASDGRTCQDIDECASGSFSCEDSELCFNILGGYRCLLLQCPPYYRQSAHRSVGKNSVSVRCHKACQPNNVACLQDTVQIVTYTVVSQPSYRHLDQPEEIVKLRTSIPAQRFNGEIDVDFELLRTDNEKSFEVIKRHFQGYVTGVVNLVKPVAGPQEIELQVLLNYTKSGAVSHRNVVVVYIVFSEFWF
nr:fibulin-1-like [Nerophis lumbriciformis]